ncbi:MAG: ApaLI family restriction endonuclease [Defluviitaleaceae bacterium]|nr:ApaLI family restriction endonuclease [Defluviitaleaceae bacterium]
MNQLETTIGNLAKKFALKLEQKVADRTTEMQQDNTAHYLIYRVLGINEHEGSLIDLYQNKGRFLYKYAGDFLEKAAFACFKHKFPQAEKITIPNNQSPRPKTFEIDCLIGNRAYEIKWRDATTDGDHITKEHTRVKAIQSQGYTPIRVMFYYPNRTQAIRIQKTLETLYTGVAGEYYYGDSAWQHILDATGVDLHQILKNIAN